MNPGGQAESSFGDWLRQRRRELDLTREELAQQIGCSVVMLRKLEAEERRPSKPMAERLAEVLQVPPSDRASFLRFARGDPFAAPSTALPTSGQARATPEREDLPDVPRGTVTFLFTDIEGSTRLLEQLREGYATVLSDQRDILRAAFAHSNGLEIDTQGDAFFVAFSRAVDAINCVIEGQQGLVQHAWPQGAAVRVRMGLHTGEPIIGRTGYVGMDVHRAARIAAAGHGGQVLLSQTTRDLIYQDLPPGTSLRALGEHKLKDIRFAQPLYQLDITGLPSEFAPLKTLASEEEPPAPGEAPFKGLQYFDEADADWFFGREGLTGRLVARVCAERFLAVIGASGSGKSSLARAGLVPALRGGGRLRASGTWLCPDVAWQISVLTPTAHPLEALAVSLTREASAAGAAPRLIDALKADPRALHLYVHEHLQLDRHGARAAGQERMLLVVDQFEELFTLCRDLPERQAFVDNLLSAASAEGGGTSVVLTLRADFYEHLATYPALSALVAQHQEYLGAMNRDELRQAIEAPAAQGGWEFSPGLVDLLLHEIGASEARPAEPGALPLLSHALLETWKRRRGNLMNLRAYTESGGVRGAIARTAEGVFQEELTPAQQAIARNIFLRLTELGEGTQDTRRRVSYGELFPEAQGVDVEEVLAQLADARLITTGEGTVEVAHEALIREWPTLRQWLDEDREGLRLHRHLTEAAQAWAAFNRDASELYRGTRLGQASEWAAAHPGQLNALEQEFLVASRGLEEREAAEREATRQRELEAAQQVAAAAQRAALAEQQRAEAQARSVRQLRRRAIYLSGALVVALVAALAAVVFGQRANVSALQANQNLSTAQAAQATSQSETNARATQQSLAEASFERAEAQRLAAEAINLSNSGGSTELIALLALHSMKQQYSVQGDAAIQTAAALDYPQQIFTPGPGTLYGMDYSPDGRYVSISYLDSNSNTGTVSIWDTQSGRLVQLFQHPSFGAAAFSPDSLSLLICWVDPYGGTGLIEIHAVETGRLIREISTGPCGTNPLWLDNRSVVLGYWDNTVRLFDVMTGQEQRIWRIADGNPWTVSSHVKYAIVSPDGGAELWNLLSGTPVVTATSTGHMSAAAISPDEAYAAVGFQDGIIQIWETATGQVVATLPGHTSGAVALDFSPDGKYLLSGGQDKTARLWLVANGQQLRSWSSNASDFRAAMFSPDGRFFVTGSGDGTARLWAVQPGPEWPVLAGHQGPLSGVAFSPNGQLLATAGEDELVRLWDIYTGQTTRTFPSDGIVNFGLRFSLDGQKLLVANWNGIAAMWSVATGSQLWQTGAESTAQYNDAAFSPDGQSLVISGRWDDPTVTYALILDARTGRKIQRAMIPGGEQSYGVDYSPDGRTLVLAVTDHNAWLLDAQTGQPIRIFSGHTDQVVGARFSPDGRYVATASSDKTTRLWDVATGQQIRGFVGHTDAVYVAAFSPDGKLLATASHDGTVRVWDVATGQELRRYASDALGNESVAWSPDGKILASVGDDGTAKLWDVDYHATIAYLCSRLRRDLTDAERAQYNITDTTPTCPK